MAVFTYSALAADGQRVSGSRRARTLGQARRDIASQGLHSLRIAERHSRWNTAITNERVARRHLQMLLRQLAIIVTSGIPILDGLTLLADETDDRIARRALLRIIDDVRSGVSLATALGDRRELLAPHHIAVVRAAEATGRLDEALSDVERDIARDVETRAAVRSAATYPIVVLALALVTVGVLAVVVLPRFETLFDDLDAEPPALTRALLTGVRTVSTLPLAAWGVAAVAVSVAVVAISRPVAAALRHRALLATPLVGRLVRSAAEERMCRVLAVSLRTGVPLPLAVASAGEATRNVVLRRRLAVAHGRILAGWGLSRALADLDLLSPAVQQMVSVGESTGTLTRQLDVTARHLADDLRRRIATVTALLEPIMIVTVGGIVGLVAVALVSAMYGLIGELGASPP